MSVTVFLGSESDFEVIEDGLDILKEFGVPFTLEVTSAHRSPERTLRLVREAEERGTAVFIAVAGKAAHLAGVVAAHTVRPVIGVPVESAALSGMDALLSTVQMPKGIPVATVALGKAGGANAALLAVEILAVGRRRPPGQARRPPEEDGREGRGDLEEAPREDMTSFAIRNFGCRVNQAEAFAWVEELRRGGLRLEEGPGRGDYRPRQFLHPDRPGRPRRAAVHPPGGPGQSRGQASS